MVNYKKMNLAILIIWFMLIVFVSTFTYQSYKAIKLYRETISVTLTPDKRICRVPFDSLPSVSSLPCCFIGESLTASRYIPSLDMVVNPVAKSYLAVCSEFCRNGISTDGSRCNDSLGQSDFERCVDISRPKNCQGPSMPVAALGITAYYPNSAGQSSCPDRRPC